MKTLGPVGAELINKLYMNNKEIFTFKDVNNLMKKNPGTNEELISNLVQKNIVARLKRGKYIIIPQQYGILKRYLGNQYVAAREIANSPDYYVAFYSAMNYWGMLTQPLLTMFVASPKRQRAPKKIAKEFKFIYVKPENIWGINEEWVTKSEKARISDRERTIIDALAHPEYTGGITEAAKGIWMTKEKIDFNRLVDYAVKYDKNVVAKRLGYLMEILDIEKPELIKTLMKYVHGRYDVFDPLMTRANLARNHWRLLDNVSPEQIKNLIWS